MVGDGFLGDIAIDEVTLSTTDCTLLPSYALPDAYDTMPGTLLRSSKSFILVWQLYNIRPL